MTSFEAPDSGYETRVRASFARQGLMATLGAKVSQVLPGEVAIEMPVRAGLSQQHGYLHAGVVTGLIDTACGYSALSLMPPDFEVLTVEFKVNFLAPASGDRVIAVGQVLRHGRRITVCRGQAIAVSGDQEQPVAAMLATMIAMPPGR